MKILMLIDSLDVGGAESHVETLADGLSALGCEVAVASAWGKTAEKMVKNDIKWLPLPSFCSKMMPNPIKIIQIKNLIDRYSKEQAPDIVHAHTRMTALLARPACKKRKIPLVTTAHALFSMKFPKNLLSTWGDATICVSEDIAHHLQKHSPTPPQNVKIIRNGIKNGR